MSIKIEKCGQISSDNMIRVRTILDNTNDNAWEYGKRYEKTTIKFELPEINDQIIIFDRRLYNWRHGDEYIYENTGKCEIPRIMTVKEFSKGRENPLRIGNMMHTTCNICNNVSVRENFLTHDFVIGTKLWRKICYELPLVGTVIDYYNSIEIIHNNLVSEENATHYVAKVIGYNKFNSLNGDIILFDIQKNEQRSIKLIDFISTKYKFKILSYLN